MTSPKTTFWIFLIFVICGVSTAEAQIWTWMQGPNMANVPPEFGTQGVEAPANNPPTLNGAEGITGADGQLYLFGGFGPDADGNTGYWNDLWRYNLDNNAWTWLTGGGAINLPGTYGTQGVPDVNNTPGGRIRPTAWATSDGKLLFFGGLGNDVNRYSDLWEYDPIAGTWTFLKGPDSPNGPGAYGTQGVADDSNNPGARHAALYWTDANGDHWMYGGFGFGESDQDQGWLNDLWTYDRSTNQWTWISGSKLIGQTPIHGTLGTPDPGNQPGGRGSAVAWTGADGNLYLFGGLISIPDGNFRFNDLWKYDIGTGNWTWLKGSDTAEAQGVIDLPGTPSLNDTPGARNGATGVTDQQGRMWLVGGYGVAVGSDDQGFLNDAWYYDPATDIWTFLRGSPSPGGIGVFGEQGEPNVNNNPPPTAASASWIANDNSLWLFGGNIAGSRFSALWRLNEGVLIPTSVGEAPRPKSLTLWPNPATDRVFLGSAIPMNARIQLADALGRVHPVIRLNEQEVDVSRLPAGIYWLTVESKDGYRIGKFVVE